MSVFVIAEAGINHNGKLGAAMALAEAAKRAGADAVKYQLFNSEKLWGDDRIKHLELRFAEMEKLHQHCERIGIEFCCTPFGVEEVLFLAPMLKRIKIASGCIARVPLLEAAASTGLPVILSTGMSDLDEVDDALDGLVGNRMSVPVLQKVTLLHCTSSYPCRVEDVNLRAMESLLDFGCPVGYSDHTNGITVAIAAVALGATVLEKHLTLDRNAEGPDHKTSITPREFKAMRLAIFDVEAALGDGVKKVLPCEVSLRAAWHGN